MERRSISYNEYADENGAAADEQSAAAENSDAVIANALRALLPAKRVENVLCLASAASTNDELRALAEAGAPDGQVVIAEEQTHGRGRAGRSFLSPQGGLYMSVLFRTQGFSSAVPSVTACAAVAVIDAVESACGFRPGVKWVNDIILGQKKIGGILTEMYVGAAACDGYIIIGIGLNVNEKKADFPAELSASASSLALYAAHGFCRARLAEAVISALDKMRLDLPCGLERYIDIYRRDCVTLGRLVSVNIDGRQQRATATAVNDDFSLSVCFADGSQRRLDGGDVSVRGVAGYV